jgi:hypothetical protein
MKFTSIFHRTFVNRQDADAVKMERQKVERAAPCGGDATRRKALLRAERRHTLGPFLT